MSNLYSQLIYNLRTKSSGKNNIAIISYLIFSYVGISVISLGTMKLELANHFNMETSKLQYLFTLFSGAITLTVIINKFFIEKFSIKMNLLLSSTAVILGTFGITAVGSKVLFAVYLILCGLGIGLYTSLANFMIINLYDKERSSKLVILHACYSACAVLTPIVAAFLINKGFSWVTVYRIFLSLVFICVALILKSDFSNVFSNIENVNQKTKKITKNLDKKVYLCSLALFLYSFFEAVMNYWIVEYLVISGITPQISKLGISSFWIFMVIGRVIVANIMQYIKLENYIKISAILAGFSLLGLLYIENIIFLFLFIGLAGMFSSALYPSILSFGTQGRKTVDSSVMTLIILAGSFGVILCSPISGLLNEIFSIKGPIISGLIAILGVFFSISGVKRIKT